MSRSMSFLQERGGGELRGLEPCGKRPIKQAWLVVLAKRYDSSCLREGGKHYKRPGLALNSPTRGVYRGVAALVV